MMLYVKRKIVLAWLAQPVDLMFLRFSITLQAAMILDTTLSAPTTRRKIDEHNLFYMIFSLDQLFSLRTAIQGAMFVWNSSIGRKHQVLRTCVDASYARRAESRCGRPQEDSENNEYLEEFPIAISPAFLRAILTLICLLFETGLYLGSVEGFLFGHGDDWQYGANARFRVRRLQDHDARGALGQKWAWLSMPVKKFIYIRSSTHTHG
jgi:hypothetical protein